MKHFIVVLLTLAFVLVPSTTQAAPFDTGFIEWTQPDNTTFVARLWGDEFFWWMETSNGYRIARGSNYWWYYATLDEDGEFYPTDARVGVDPPPGGSYQLDRSASRIAALNEEIAQFNEQIALNAQWFAAKQDAAMNIGAPVILKVGVILIEFQDTTHYRDTTNPNLYYGYQKADFDSMLFSSSGYWFDTTTIDGTPHPENEKVFGSFRDYWWQMSRPNGTPGSLIITGQVVNPVDSNGVPVWIRADHNRSYYETIPDPQWRALAYEAIRKADSLGYIDTTNPGAPNHYDKLGVIYARDAIYAGALRVHAERIGGRYYLMAERNGFQLYGTAMAFSHIGTHLHEFGHNLGFDEEYTGSASDDGNTNLFNFDLMAWGIYNGPGRKGGCPATLSPYYRVKKRWVTPIELWFTRTNFEVEYDYSNPKIYKITPAASENDEHYVIETKLRYGFDSYIPSPPDSFVYQPGTLLVWHHNVLGACGYVDRVRIKHADNTREWGSLLTDFFPSNSSTNSQNLNDISTPAATLGSPDYVNPGYPECNNERPAHFLLNGIHKLTNGNTLIDTIDTFRAIVQTPVVSGWHMLSVPDSVFDFAASAVWPTASSAAFEYVCGQGYQPRSTLENGPGYFIKFDSTHTLTLTGGIRKIDTAFVCANWNLVGSITDAIPLSNICMYPYPDNKLLSVFKYQNGYIPVNTITPGLGHWVKVSTAGLLVFRRDPADCGAEGDGLAVEDFDHFTITDAEGKQQDVYVANAERDPSLVQRDLSMPPPLPDAGFDARFESASGGDFIKAVSPDSGVVELVINVETQAYPITVTWELNPENGIEYSITSQVMGKPAGAPANNSFARAGSTVMTAASGGKFRMNAQAIGRVASNLPNEYLLAQNYPNPFNPTTQIHFELPEDGSVRLFVYDLLGREVATLLNEFKKAGRYDVTFVATNLATGVYFYRFQAGAFHDVKKLLLLR